MAPKHLSLRPAKTIELLQQLQWLLEADMPLMSALSLLKTLQSTPMAQAVVERLIVATRQGQRLSAGFESLPSVFPAHLPAVIAAGEASGTLPALLKDLVIDLKRIQQTRQNVLGAVAYPIAILVAAIAITIGLLFLVVPQFETMFAQFEVPLPWATQQLIYASQSLRSHGIAIIIVVLILMGLTSIAHHKLRLGPWLMQAILNMLPGASRLIEQQSWATITQRLSSLIAAGIALDDALDWTLKSTRWPNHQHALRKASRSITQGLSLSQALGLTQHCPAIVRELSAVGEHSGQTAQMLAKSAQCLQDDVNFRLHRLAKLAEPFMMVAVGCLVGGLLMALYLPIFNMTQVVM